MEFKLLNDIEDVDFNKIKQITSAYASYSDFNLLSLLCWNVSGTTSYHLGENCITLKMRDYLTSDYIYSFLGTDNTDEALKLLLKQTSTLRLIPETTIDSIKIKEEFQITEDINSFDYVLDLNKLAKLESSSYKELRRHVRNFEKDYGTPHIKELNLQDRTTQDTILDLSAKWINCKNLDEERLSEDQTTLKNFIKFEIKFNTLNLGLYIQNKLVAFTLNEILDANWTMGHFGKSNYEYKNSSKVLEHYTSEYLRNKGFKYMNLQQDTGILGLRKAKMSLKPIYFLKKFNVTLYDKQKLPFQDISNQSSCTSQKSRLDIPGEFLVTSQILMM